MHERDRVNDDLSVPHQRTDDVNEHGEPRTDEERAAYDATGTDTTDSRDHDSRDHADGLNDPDRVNDLDNDPDRTDDPSRTDGLDRTDGTPEPGFQTTADENDREFQDPDYTEQEFRKDPYAATSGGDVLVEPAPARTLPAEESMPTESAPAQSGTMLFDQDPEQVRTRWRDVQAAFVDDPREAVERADVLLDEIVTALTSSLTSRTSELRDRWKNTDQSDTEQLRLSLREYRTSLERLLTLSSAEKSSAGNEVK